MGKGNLFRDARTLQRQHVAELAENISDREVFESPEAQAYATGLAQNMTSDKSIKALVAWDIGGKVGCTNGNTIYVNAGHPSIQSFVSLADRLQIVTGVLLHEIAHCKYLDFEADAKAQLSVLEDGVLYGPAPTPSGPEDQMAIDEMAKALQDVRFRKIFVTYLHKVTNILNDKHDELALIRDYGQFERACLNRANDAFRRYDRVDIETILAAVESGKKPAAEAATGSLLEFLYFGDLYMIDRSKTEATDFYKRITSLEPYLKAAEVGGTPELFAAANQSLMKIWPYISQEIKDKADQKQQSNSGGSGGSGGNSATSSGSSGGSGGNSTSGSGGNGGEKSGQQSGSPSGGAGQAGSDGSQSPSEEEMKRFEEALASLTDADINDLAQQIADAAKGMGTPKPERPPEKPKAPAPGQKSNEQPQQPQNGAGAGPSAGDEEMKKKAEENANRLLQQVLQNMAEKMTASELDRDLIELGRGTGFNSSHKNRKHTVRRSKREDATAYAEAMSDQKNLLNAMTRQMKVVFADISHDAVRRHLYMGSRFRAADAYRLDGRVFTKKKEVSDTPELAVALLVDKSGSMAGQRMQAAQKSALLVYELCSNFKIPCMVCSHNTNGMYGMDFEIYSDFRHQKKDRYRIAAGLSDTGGCNRDGMALQIAAHMLEARPEPVKLLMVISDGQPNDFEYSGREAERDIQEIVKVQKRHGINTIAFAIGDDKDRIAEIYGSGFVDISDLSAMPRRLAKLVKGYILKSVA